MLVRIGAHRENKKDPTDVWTECFAAINSSSTPQPLINSSSSNTLILKAAKQNRSPTTAEYNILPECTRILAVCWFWFWFWSSSGDTTKFGHAAAAPTVTCSLNNCCHSASDDCFFHGGRAGSSRVVRTTRGGDGVVVMPSPKNERTATPTTPIVTRRGRGHERCRRTVGTMIGTSGWTIRGRDRTNRSSPRHRVRRSGDGLWVVVPLPKWSLFRFGDERKGRLPACQPASPGGRTPVSHQQNNCLSCDRCGRVVTPAVRRTIKIRVLSVFENCTNSNSYIV